MRFEPFSWPLGREGLRRAMNRMSRMTNPRSSDGAWTWAGAPGLGWMLVIVGLLIGFGASSQMSTTHSGVGEPEANLAEVVGADALPNVAAASDAWSENSATPDITTTEAITEPVAGDRVAGVEVSIAEDSAIEVVANYAAISIDSLPIHRSSAQLDAVESLTIVTRGEIGSGESLGSSLQRQGISPGTIHLIASEMRKVFDFRRSRPGDAYRLGQDSDGRVLDFRYSQGPEESFYLAWEGTRYVVRQETAELRPQIAKIAGVVDSSFYGAVLALGEQSSLASEFARILAWDIDFSRNVHPGDEFQILYERLYRRNDDGDEIYVRPGRVLAGHYNGNVGEYTVVYFEDERGAGAYFRPDGSSVERAFLAAPLEFSRISSRFTRARRHPILNVTRAHPGIDYAAPRGTPIWAVADGVVEYRARAGASGNLVRIRHAGGYTSHYAHLANFASDITVGDHVEQKQLIGYVGSTGLSTGPHVCFRVKKDGRYVDPMRIASPAGAPVDEKKRPIFENIRDQLLADLGPGLLSVDDEAL
jgi:murein DD-endopeptidase MepM/ murein hydrolase activator NlpD